MTSLGSLDGGANTLSFGINNRGEVVGETYVGSKYRAFLWRKGRMIDLGDLGGGVSRARAINDFGQVVGTSLNGRNFNVPFVWSNGKMTELQFLLAPGTGWFLTEVASINNAGQIVGSGNFSGGGDRAYLLDLNACIDTDGNGNPDNDGDGLCDDWETDGIDFDKDGVIDLRLYPRSTSPT
ncbi:hypothetical protein [Corallococcus sp. CA053C]|uniref:hypothetical protein n=1 Tax=Corallococcus sp. CA053C TaxID=2316732 RepID=UPI00131523C4|nr:hypothetical protein [Corallococcus sp. CA053C]